MKHLILFYCFHLLSNGVIAQSEQYGKDLKSVEEAIKKNVFKQNYQYLITYSEKADASFSVKAKTDYVVFFVYNNEKHPLVTFRAYLMTPDNKLRKQYTAAPDDLAQVGLARVQRLKFTTSVFNSGKASLPVKLEANPAATMYIFYKK